MNETIKNPSLIPEWFITSGGKVIGIKDADGREYQFVGSSEKGEDGKTPDLRINSANGYKWESRYSPADWNEIPGSPAASGMVGPQGETGPSGNSIVLQSAEQVEGGIQVTLAWGENETSAFVIPSGAPGSSITAGTDLVLDNGVMKVNTNGVANSAGMAFVEGIDTVASGDASHAEGRNTSAMSDYSHTEGYENKDFKIEGLIGANHVEGAYNQTSAVYSHVEGHANTLYGYGVHMQGGYNEFYSHNLSADKSNPEERWNIWGQSIEGMANKTTTEPTSGTPGEPDFGYVHGGILKVIGNGTRTKTDDSDPKSEVITRSDALILYRDGSMWVQGPISANGVELGAGGASYQGRNGVNVAGDYIELTQSAYNALISVSGKVDKPDTTQTELNNKYLIYSTLSGADQPKGWVDMQNKVYSKTEADGTFVNKTTYNADKATFLTINKAFVSGTNFDTLGQSRLDSNNTCLGTNWMGVSVSHAGFFKFIDGQNPGDTLISNAGSGIQIEFKPDITQGELNIINTYAGTETSTKVINVPAASYTNMSTFDSENGPNYMLRKTANGFDIGAAVINTTALPENVQANAYYFIYEM